MSRRFLRRDVDCLKKAILIDDSRRDKLPARQLGNGTIRADLGLFQLEHLVGIAAPALEIVARSDFDLLGCHVVVLSYVVLKRLVGRSIGQFVNGLLEGLGLGLPEVLAALKGIAFFLKFLEQLP
jgi:hypothetical protein